jgi:hypothetical protein
LLGLLVVAYLGSQFFGTRASGYGFASGAEFLLLGLVCGPYTLGVIERSTIVAFEPIAAVGTAWLTLIVGVDYGFLGDRRVRLPGFFGGILLSFLSGAATAVAAYFVARQITPVRGRDLWLLSIGIGLVSCETARHAVRWVVSRHSVEGPLASLIGEIADSDDLVPLLGLMASFSLSSNVTLSVGSAWWASSVLTLGLGAVVGATAAALLRSEPKASDGWGVLLGGALLGIGLAWRLGLSPQTVTFAMGLSLSALSRHGVELRAMFERSERPVLLPTLVLAGAQVKVDHVGSFVVVVLIALVVRIAVRLLAAPVLTAMARVPRAAAPPLSLGLLPTGAITMAIGLVFSMRFAGAVGDTVLAVAAVFTVFGEVVGPAALRRALVAAGELKNGHNEPAVASTEAQ